MPADALACTGGSPESSPIVLIAYENLQAARHAFDILRRAFTNAEASADFHPLLWSFERLQELASRVDAAADAAKADILVIAANGKTPFSPELRQWLVACLENKRGQTAAIVTVFPPAEPGTSNDAGVKFLRLVAEQSGLDFFRPDGNPLEDTQNEGAIHSVSRPDSVARHVKPKR